MEIMVSLTKSDLTTRIDNLADLIDKEGTGTDGGLVQMLTEYIMDAESTFSSWSGALAQQFLTVYGQKLNRLKILTVGLKALKVLIEKA